MTDATPEIRPLIDVYHGSRNAQEFGRGIKRCEAVWNKDRHVGTFDDILVRQLNLAKSQNRNVVNILDIGSGDAILFKEFLNNPQICPQARKFLAENAQLSLRLIGITDATSPEQMYVTKELSQNTTLNSNIHARNVYYSLTARQRLNDFLVHEHIDELDLVTATWSLTYMGTNVFRQVMEDTINHLRPMGGEMIVAAYAEQEIPGFRSPEPMFPHILDVRNIDNTENALLKRALEDDHMRFYTRGVNIDEEEKGVVLAEDYLVKLGVLDEKVLQEARGEYQDDLNKGNRKKSGALSIRTHQTISISIEKLARKKALELKNLKKRILADLEEQFKDKVSLKYSDRVITAQNYKML